MNFWPNESVMPVLAKVMIHVRDAGPIPNTLRLLRSSGIRRVLLMLAFHSFHFPLYIPNEVGNFEGLCSVCVPFL